MIPITSIFPWVQLDSLHLTNRDLAAIRPDPVRILDVGAMFNHSDRANSTGGAMAWLLKLQSKMLGDTYLLQ